MDLRNTQIKDTYGNLVTLGTTSGAPTTGFLQNGQGSNVTALTMTSTTLEGGLVVNELGVDADFRVEGLNEANLLFVDASTDRVGIGTSSPSQTLNVNGIGLFEGSAQGNIIIQKTGTNGFSLFSDAAGTLGFYDQNGAATRMKIDSSGNVGIGTTSPAAKIQVAGVNGSAIAYLYNNSGAAGQVQGVSIEAGTNSSDYALSVASSVGTSYLRVRGDGNVGIGTSSPAKKLDVSGAFSSVYTDIISSTDTAHIFRGTPDTAGYEHAKILSSRDTTTYAYGSYLAFYTEGKSSGTTDTSTEKVRIDSSGNVGIGTSSPNAKLHVSGAGLVGNFVGSTYGQIQVQSTGTNQSAYFTGNPDGTGKVIFQYGSTDVMQYDSSGNVGIGTGSPAVKLDVNGAVRASTGILFGSDTAAANTLDDYEEGTWTPVLTSSGGGETVTYNYQVGWFTKIGGIIYYNIYVNVATVSGGSGGVRLSIPTANSSGSGFIDFPVGSGFTTDGGIDNFTAVSGASYGVFNDAAWSDISANDELRATGFYRTW